MKTFLQMTEERECSCLTCTSCGKRVSVLVTSEHICNDCFEKRDAILRQIESFDSQTRMVQ